MSDPDYTLPISQIGKTNQKSQTKYGYKALSQGDVIGKKYQIIQELGSGGFATTYLATIKDCSDKKCVIKQLQPRFNSPAIWENARERLDTEGMVLQWLGKHEQIPELLDHFDENSQFYLVLEFIEGEEFDREVQKNLLNETQTILFLNDVLNILEFVHQQGVIHRDIKPSNLIRRGCDGKMTLIDFGAVKEIGTAMFESPQETLQTQVIGTPGYMPPEQNNGKPIYSSDLYALGKTAIYGLTGRSPTDWEEAEANERYSWQEITKIGRELEQIINKMTAVKTGERYQSAQEVLQDLTPLLKVGTTVDNRYLILNYLGGDKHIGNYLVKNFEDPSCPLFYLKILTPLLDKHLNIIQIKENIEREIIKVNEIYDKQNSLRIVKCFLEGDSICLLQDYREGATVFQLIKNQGRFSEEKVIDLLIDATTALVSCHKQQIIHGNIQPLSLFQRKDNQQVILKDFGNINNFTNDLFNSNLGYIPPEQIAGRITFASDVYALGMTAIHCLTGTIPQKLNISHQTGAILWEQSVKVNPNFSKIINKMVSLERQKRYSSATQVLKALKSLKRKSRMKPWYIWLIVLPILFGVGVFFLAQWAQRAAILEFYTGDLKLENKEYRKAIQYYEEGLRKLPKTRRQVQNFEQVWLQKARAYNLLKEYEGALETCQEALRHYKSYRLLNCQGLALDNLKQHESAIAAYDKAIALEPDNAWSWNNRGDAYAKLGKVDEAISDLQQAVRLNPSQSFVPWNNLGKLFFQQRNYQEAIASYENALSVKDDYIPSLVGLGNAYKSVRDFGAARETYDRAIELNPDSYESWYGKALIAESLREDSEAQQAYEQALKIRPDWQPAIEGLARVGR